MLLLWCQLMMSYFNRRSIMTPVLCKQHNFVVQQNEFGWCSASLPQQFWWWRCRHQRHTFLGVRVQETVHWQESERNKQSHFLLITRAKGLYKSWFEQTLELKFTSNIIIQQILKFLCLKSWKRTFIVDAN